MRAPTQYGLDLDRIFDAHFAEIHRYIGRRLSPDIADDLAAEVFLVAAGGGYDPSRGEARPWLYGIATKLISRHRRSEIRRWKALSPTCQEGRTVRPQERRPPGRRPRGTPRRLVRRRVRRSAGYDGPIPRLTTESPSAALGLDGRLRA